MSNLEVRCPWCNEQLEAPPSLKGQSVTCPSCGKDFQICASGSQFPIIIRSSLRALYATYIWRAVAWLFGFTCLLCATLLVNEREVPAAKVLLGGLWLVFGVLLFVAIIQLWLKYRRLKNTVYRIYPNKIEASSYLFRFLGAYNNVVNLSQLRQIQASANSLLDLWFFHCGKIAITVSGDATDFVLLNVYRPEDVRKQIEEIAFGKANVDQSASPTPEVGF